MAAAITDSVNNSREPVREICHNTQGSTRRPAMSMMAMNAATSSRVLPIVSQRDWVFAASAAGPPRMPASGGSRTSTSTVARSSTTSQPTAMRPVMLSIAAGVTGLPAILTVTVPAIGLVMERTCS